METQNGHALQHEMGKESEEKGKAFQPRCLLVYWKMRNKQWQWKGNNIKQTHGSFGFGLVLCVVFIWFGNNPSSNVPFLESVLHSSLFHFSFLLSLWLFRSKCCYLSRLKERVSIQSLFYILVAWPKWKRGWLSKHFQKELISLMRRERDE